jgi:hypothetical protein
MPLTLSKDCTRAFDAAIAEERVRYASERLDFHAFFWGTTVLQLQKVLRREEKLADPDVPRKELVGDLFRAQQESPHRLWELLLLQLVEPTLVKRRRALSSTPDAHLDDLVVSTFLGALQNLPFAVCWDHMQEYVLRISRQALKRRLQEERGDPPRPGRKKRDHGPTRCPGCVRDGDSDSTEEA